MKLYFESDVERPLTVVKNHFNLNLFQSLKPPGLTMKVLRFDGCSPGNEVHLQLGIPGNLQKWVSVIVEEKEEAESWYFIDEGRQMPWPLKVWKHQHKVIALSESSCKIIDDISYSCVKPWMDPLMRPFLWCTFSIRPSRYKKFFGNLK